MSTKDELEENEEDWHHVASTNGYRCTSCNEIPPYGEQEIYFETGLCGWHAHIDEKDD